MTHIQVQNYTNHASYVPQIHTGHTKHPVLGLSDVCSNQAPLNYSGQNSKNILQLQILTYMRPWNKVIKPGMNC